MSNFINNLIDIITKFLSQFGIFSGFLLVYSESILPFLPLSVFVALNVYTYGKFIGFIISWLATVLGCLTAFSITRKFSEYIINKTKYNKKLISMQKHINKLTFSEIIVILAFPFTPAFLVNIASGISSIRADKYIYALLIGKIPMIYFWTFIGANFKESLTNPQILIKIIILLLISYIISKLVSKLLKD